MLRRLLGTVFTIALLLVFAGPAIAVPARAPVILLDSQRISFDVQPIIENGRTLVPLRQIFERLDANLSWDEYTQTVTATKDNTTVKLQIGNENALVNNQTMQLDIPGKIVNGRTMIPVRFIGNAFGASVVWDPNQNQVNITSITIAPIKSETAIGLNLELSGGAAPYGKNANKGIQLAFQEYQDLGLQMAVVDCKTNAEEAFVASQKLLKQNIIAQIGPLTSGNVGKIAPLLEEYGIPLLSPAATSPVITQNPETGETYNYIFRVCFKDPLQGNLMAAFASQELKAKTCAIIFDCSSDYSKSLADSFKTSFMKSGGQIVLEDNYNREDTDFTQLLEKVKNQKFDFLYVPGYYTEVGLLIKQARAIGINQPIGGCDGWDSTQMTVLAGSQAMNNTYLVNHFSPDDTDQTVVDFVKRYKVIYGELPDIFAALGYDSTKLLLETIRNSKSYDPQTIAVQLSKIENFPGVTGVITMGSDHNPIKSGVIMEYRDGKQVFKQRIYVE